MSRPGTEQTPLRVAVVGSGPAGFYTAQQLFQSKEHHVRVDMFERLLTPFGLVRHGVAPDHQKIKNVTAVYDRLARDERFRYFGNVEYGSDLLLADLSRHYHAIVFATGAQTDRRLGIPGEDLTRSHPATEFVAWYNGHPDYVDHQFDLEQECAVVVGVGNVAVDVARILCRTPQELARTDIADYALDALSHSRIRQVYLLGRRGPAQAAFTNPEIKELGELEGAEATTLADEMTLDPLSAAAVAAATDKATPRKLALLRALTGRNETDKERRLILRFLVSPTELLDDGHGAVGAVKIVRNRLVEGRSGRIQSSPTDAEEILKAGLVFRSVGYRGVPLAGLPFREDWAIVPNDEGQVLEAADGPPIQGLFVSGWIKRGPSGVIGTNKPDAAETVAALLAAVARGSHLAVENPEPDAIPSLLKERGIRAIDYDSWLVLDRLERERGAQQQRPRVKLTHRDEFERALAN